MLILFGLLLLFCGSLAYNGHIPHNCSNEYEDVKNYFNDAFGRDIMFPLAAAAYSDNPQACLNNQMKGAQVVGKYEAECGPLPFPDFDHCYGYTAVSHCHKAIIIGFRGIDQIMQLLMKNFQTVFEKKVAIYGGGKVGRYYHDALNSVWVAGMRDDVKMLALKHPNYQVWITGHSLGGSMAAICAHELASRGVFKRDQIVTVTFGESRTGDIQFAEQHNKLLKYTYRVVNRHDFMPHVPLGLFGYQHYKYEVWYEHGMDAKSTYKLCHYPEDKRCSEGHLFHVSPDDYFNYYNHFILTYGKHGCVDTK